MDPQKWRVVVEVVGLSAVVISLGLLAYELRENTRALEAGSRQEFASQDLAYISSALDSSVVARAEAKLLAGEDLTHLEVTQLAVRQHMNFRIFENAYYQFSIGALEKSEWERYAQIIEIIMCEEQPASVAGSAESEPARVMWERYGPGFTSEFREIVDMFIAQCGYQDDRDDA